jgi:hypothetical protein
MVSTRIKDDQEKLLVKYGKTKFADGSERNLPKPKRGYDIWIEDGTWYTARKISTKNFGGHSYDNGGFKRGERFCTCGCFMGGWSSDGPVNPFGACPLNPIETPKKKRNKK